MKYTLLALILTVLVGCEPSTDDITKGYVMPSILADCKIFKLYGSGETLYVVVCPETISTNWETRHSNGKSSHTESHSVTVKNKGLGNEANTF